MQTYSFAELLILGQSIPDVLPDDEEGDSPEEDMEEPCASPVQESGPALVFDDMEI